MRLLFEGQSHGGAAVRLCMDLVDHYDAEHGLLSMARTTGFTATAAARLVLDGSFARPGVHPPEVLGFEAGLCRRLFGELGMRGIRFTEREEELTGS